MGINRFAFMSDEEFLGNYLGAQNCSATAQLTLEKKKHNQEKLDMSDVPSAIDWRELGVISAVKD